MGFINPAAFLLSVFVVGLVLLYLWERNQQRFDVPSLMLWEAIPEPVVRRNRFQPDPLFWLQLAVLSALILGLADPYFAGSDGNNSSRRAILVVDLSASMQAAEGTTTRLELARRAAASVVESSAVGTEFMIVVASETPRTTAEFTSDTRDILHRLDRLAALDTAARLEPALAIARRAANDPERATEVHVFTDVPRETIDERWRRGMYWWPVGASDDNLAIASVEVSQGVLQGHRDATALVGVRNFSRSEKHGALAIQTAGHVFARKLFTLQRETTAYFHFDHIPASGVLVATLANHDALPLDNRSFAWVRPSHPVRLALIAAPSSFADQLRRIAATTDAIEIRADSPTPPEQWSGIDVAVFHREVPAVLPDVPSLLIAPASGRPVRLVNDEGVNRSTTTPQFEVLDWNDSHPTLRGIDPRLFQPFTNIIEVTPPPWSEAVLRTQANGRDLPILLAGEVDKRRRAILTVDLENMNLLSTDRETTLLLLLNLLDWLSRGSEGVRIAETGSSIQLAAAGQRVPTVTAPGGRIVELSRGESPVLQLDLAGLYEVHRESGTTTIAANFNSPRESDIGRPPPRPYRPDGEVSRGEHNTPANGLGAWLYMVGATLLILEWFAAGRVA